MTDDATKMKQERDLALAECERLRTRHWTILDDMNKSELDAYDLGCAESIAAVDKILDGKDDGSGTNNEPWYTQRKRLLSLTAECERLRAALEEFVSIVGTEAGFETAMTESDDAFTEFLNKQQARVDSAVANASALLDAARGKP